jgi:hypothetical protein
MGVQGIWPVGRPRRDVRLELKGKLSIRAAELELEATRGNARVEASDRVCLVGELVELN